MDKPQFKCTQCGCCCRKILSIKEAEQILPPSLLNAIRSFPYKHLADGRCEMLTPDNLCRVYNHRPDICNVQKMFTRQSAVKDLREWYNLNNMQCNALMDACGSKAERIKI